MTETQKHYVDANGNHFVASFFSQAEIDAFDPGDAVEIAPPPSSAHVWSNGAWVLPEVPEPTPADVPLSMRQLRLGLVRNGFPVDFVKQAIAAIEDDLERAEATIWYEETSSVEWAHPMTQALMATAATVNPAFTLELAATMWMEAASFA